LNSWNFIVQEIRTKIEAIRPENPAPAFKLNFLEVSFICKGLNQEPYHDAAILVGVGFVVLAANS
jgi:hypothetical protein